MTEDFLQQFDTDLRETIKKFGEDGKIFSNEEQFQFELAWKLKEKGYNVRLEVLSCSKDDFKEIDKEGDDDKRKRKIKKMYTDIVVDFADNKSVAIELKYKTWAYASKNEKKIEYNVGNHRYVVFHQGAPNIGCYQYLEDVARLEELAGIAEQYHTFDNYNNGTRNVVCGYAIMISNDETYWKGPKDSKSVMRDFFLYDNDEKTGEKKSIPTEPQNQLGKNGKESKREYKLQLKKEYTCYWKDYYHDNDPGKPDFRYLILQIPPKANK